jgi:ribosome recycling factor
MEKSVEDFRANLLSTRTGRANVHMLDQVKVDYYGTDTPISQVAQISTPEAQLILVSPWETAIVPAVEKAIRTSNLGFNPMHDGKVIRVPIPPMTEERRREAVKHLAGVLEDHKTAIRNIRRRRKTSQRRDPAAHRRRDPPRRRPLQHQGKRDHDRLNRVDDLLTLIR